MNRIKKFNRKIGVDFNTAASQRTHLPPARALDVLQKLLDRTIVEDARTYRQSKDREGTPAVLTMLEYKALRDATRLLGVRLKLLHTDLQEKKVS